MNEWICCVTASSVSDFDRLDCNSWFCIVLCSHVYYHYYSLVVIATVMLTHWKENILKSECKCHSDVALKLIITEIVRQKKLTIPTPLTQNKTKTSLMSSCVAAVSRVLMTCAAAATHSLSDNHHHPSRSSHDNYAMYVVRVRWYCSRKLCVLVSLLSLAMMNTVSWEVDDVYTAPTRCRPAHTLTSTGSSPSTSTAYLHPSSSSSSTSVPASVLCCFRQLLSFRQ